MKTLLKIILVLAVIGTIFGKNGESAAPDSVVQPSLPPQAQGKKTEEIVSPERRAQLLSFCRKTIREQLARPSSADFSLASDIIGNKSQFSITGSLTALNNYGAKLNFLYKCVYKEGKKAELIEATLINN